jgi:hypothetical protein
MFTLKITVKDKHIGEVLERLKGFADTLKVDYDMPAKPKPPSRANGEHYARSPDAIELLTLELHKRKVLQIKGPEFKAIVVGLGLPESSYSYYIAGLVKAGVLREHARIGTAKVYRVTGK